MTELADLESSEHLRFRAKGLFEICVLERGRKWIRFPRTSADSTVCPPGKEMIPNLKSITMIFLTDLATLLKTPSSKFPFLYDIFPPNH